MLKEGMMHTRVSISCQTEPIVSIELFFGPSNSVMKYTCITIKRLSNLKYAST